MSVVVRMEMPEDCRTCPFSTICSFCEGYSDYCVLAPDGTKCGWSFMDGEFPTERPSWCPIICALPEGHGRLVDADACAGVLRKLENEAVKPTEMLCFGYAAKMFEEAFTIVPADASDAVAPTDTPTDTPTVTAERSET